jgi:hypothetical protein
MPVHLPPADAHRAAVRAGFDAVVAGNPVGRAPDPRPR